MSVAPSRRFIICLLGTLSVISPFSIDMYLPAFPKVAQDLGVQSSAIALTLSSYFIGMALGQIFYGPLLDRFGRKKPLLAGLALYILASAGCMVAPGIQSLIVMRFVQALGGCAAGVASLAMVRDFFPVKESAKVLSMLFLFIAASPLLAPSIGGLMMQLVGWRSVFLILAGIVALIFLLVFFKLPEGHTPDTTISLKPGPIMREYLAIIRHPTFITYAMAGAFSFAGLFTYVAGSPLIFMEGFHLSAQVYSGIFALLAMGFIGGSQLNVYLLKSFESEALFIRVLLIQVITGAVFLIGTLMGWYGLYSTLVLFFIYLSCAGLTYPNAAAMALAPFTKNAGSAAALLGFLQLGVGSLISTGISIAPTRSSLPIIIILAVTSCMGMLILLMGRTRAAAARASEFAAI